MSLCQRQATVSDRSADWSTSYSFARSTDASPAGSVVLLCFGSPSLLGNFWRLLNRLGIFHSIVLSMCHFRNLLLNWHAKQHPCQSMKNSCESDIFGWSTFVLWIWNPYSYCSALRGCMSNLCFPVAKIILLQNIDTIILQKYPAAGIWD